MRTPRRRAEPPSAAPASLLPAEGRLLGILVGNPRARAAVLGNLEMTDFSGSRVEPILRTLVEEARDDPDGLDAASIMAQLPDEASRNLVARALLEQEGDGTEEDARDCLRAVRKKRLSLERGHVQRELERTADPAVVNNLLSRKMELSRKIDALS